MTGSKNERTRLQTDIICAIRRRIAKTKASFLPTTRELSIELQVSVPTLLKALGVLRNEGLICYGRGRRIQIVGRKPPEKQKKRSSSVEMLIAEIREMILRGSIKNGDSVPKSRHFVSAKHLSPATISRAMHKLALEGVIHKRGRYWIVGAQAKVEIKGILTHPDVILVAVSKPGMWRSLCNEPSTAQFCRSFLLEAESRNIKVQTVLTDNRTYPGIMVSGRHAIKRLIESLRNRFRGLLIPQLDQSVLPALPLFHYVLSCGMPIVSFNAGDTRYSELDQLRIHRSYCECIHDLSQSCEVIVDFLRNTNHQEFGFVHQPGDADSTDVFEMLRNAVHRGDSFIECTGIHPTNVFWEKLFSGSLSANINRLRNHGLPHMKNVLDSYRALSVHDASAQLQMLQTKTRGAVLGYSPTLAPVLRENSKIRLLLCANHLQARLCYYWLRAAGIPMPDGVSLLSMGDSVSSIGMPISLIDTGLSYLGRSAFHALLYGDMRKLYPTGTILPKPRFVDRGSFGYPGSIDFAGKLLGHIL